MACGIRPPCTLRDLRVSARARQELARDALELIVAELRASGITPRPLTVLAHGLDGGLGERLSVEAAALLQEGP
jgi:hypothetical protein